MTQSASAIDSVTLAAWGTTFRAPDGTLANRIVSRIIVGGVPAVAEQDISGPDARPSGFVQVIAATGAFLLLWNDARSDAPGLYARRIGPDGVPLGDAMRIDSGHATPDSTGAMQVLNDGPAHVIILLQLARQGGGLFALTIDDAGNPNRPLRRLGDALLQVLRYERLPGLWLLRLDGARPLMMKADGVRDVRPIRNDLFSAPFHIAADTSLLRLVADTVQYFQSIFDSAPSRQVRVPGLDTIVANSKLITLDSAGALHLFFTTVRYILMFRVITGYDLVIAWDGTPSAATEVFNNRSYDGYNDADAKNYFVSALTGCSWTIGCDNTGLVTLAWEYTQYIHSNPQPRTTGTTRISLDDAGRYRITDQGYLSSCTVPANASIVRVSDTSRSSVRVVVDGDTVVMTSESAPRVIDIPEQSPVIGTFGDRVLSSWIRQGTEQHVMLGQLRSNRAEPVSMLDSVKIGPPPFRIIDKIYQGTLNFSKHVLTSIDGALGFMYNDVTADIETIWTTQASYHSTLIFKGTNHLYLPDTTGWRSVLSFNDGPIDIYYTRGACHEMRAMAYDPNTNQYLVGINTLVTSMPPGITEVAVRGIPAAGTGAGWILDTLRSSMIGGALVPLEAHRALRIANDTAFRLTTGAKPDTFLLPRMRYGASYMRLLGPRFLRWYWIDSLNTQVGLDLFDLDCRLLATQRIVMPPSWNRVTIVQSRHDSAIAVVHADTTGVYAALLDDMLAVVVPEATISSAHTSYGTPSAAFLHDTLFVVWCDTRNGGYDIYGSVLVGARKAGVAAREETIVASAEIVPTPARDRASLWIAVRADGELLLDLFNITGTLIRSDRAAVRSGENMRELPLEGIPSGLYMLRYRIGAQQGWISLPVVR